MPDLNPYAPPVARPEPGPRRRTPLATLLRAAAVVAGFSLLAGPTRPAPDLPQPRGQVAARVAGALLLVSAFFPLGRRRMTAEEGDPPPEEL